jgi:outer membrane protein OmpA-like peptidoglycan-associated protein
MINLKKACLLATVGAMLAPAAMAADYAKDVVKDKRGNVVMNTFNNCVVTKWDAASDECRGGSRTDLHKLSREMRTVYFDFNKSTINAKEKAKLDDLSKLVKGAKDVESVDMVGFADKIGNASYNKRLSTKRAETVKAYLAAKGLKTRKVRVEGMGDTKPVTNCNHSDRKQQISCLAEDRRVEVQFNFIK